jgi:FtsP/CotA-like multicopper oxidase with cupredoxin domain
MRRKTETWLRAAAALAVLLSAAHPLAAESFPEPPRIPVTSDPVELYVQFTVFDVLYPGRAQVTPTWTRAYGLEAGKSLIPGPSFYFRPGDLLQVTLNNLLDTNSEDAGFNEVLEQYETNLIEHVHGEINIPHNSNNTNLHVHGLHVDPSQDDVTLILIPQGDSKLNYSQALWPYIREQVWPYRYRGSARRPRARARRTGR